MVGDHSRQMTNMASLEDLGQTSDDYPIYRQNLGWSAKSKIPDRLGFSRHMKTRLIMHTQTSRLWDYPIYRQNLGRSAKT